MRPTSLEEAAALVAAASREGRTLRIGADLATDGLDRVLEHETGDLTCTVEAGLRLSALQGALAGAGQRLSLDPPGDPTVGACVALALSGPLRHRFGSPRDLVLGVTLVLGDGTIASAGGKVVKNVAGYDLAKLACGSRGALGLVARVALRLHPVAETARTLVVEDREPAEVVAAVRASRLVPSALDVLHPGRVALLFEGGARGVDGQLATARALVGGAEAGTEVWQEARTRQAGSRGVLRFAPGRLAEALAPLDEAVVRAAAGVAYVPHAVAEERPPALLALEERVRRAFDPQEILVA